MSVWLGRVTVVLKASVNDPQGLAVLDGLHAMGYSEVEQVRVGKHIDVRVRADSHEQAEQRIHQMCESLLANTLIESYTVEVGAPAEAAR